MRKRVKMGAGEEVGGDEEEEKRTVKIETDGWERRGEERGWEDGNTWRLDLRVETKVEDERGHEQHHGYTIWPWIDANGAWESWRTWRWWVYRDTAWWVCGSEDELMRKGVDRIWVEQGGQNREFRKEGFYGRNFETFTAWKLSCVLD